MKKIILCKYGEIILKGQNKSHFESMLLKEVRRRADAVGSFKVAYSQSTVTIEPVGGGVTDEDLEEMYRQAKKVFGFSGVTMAACAEKNMEDIARVAKEYLPPILSGYETFKCSAKRGDKSFPLTSPEISAEVGGAILSVMPKLKVDLYSPEVEVRVEIREKEAYIHAGQDKGAGGNPPGSSGRGLLLLSGGIDSPVAGYMMAKRGMFIDALHFESFPYTSERAREKVFALAKELTEYTGRIRVHVISLTHIQEVIRDTCDEDYFTLLLRRFMMELALRTAKEFDIPAIITGESLGQVASQTLPALCVTDAVSDIPVFRPCIGMDKDEIVAVARKIGTFDTSVLPYEDCCTVFTPRHPRTRPVIEKVVAQEEKLDRASLLEEAYATRYSVLIKQFEDFE
ncbi:MAG: tRNA 4-thiouridine(8) synthase ThiI [Clostridia bacterium]|nr:tRNA 4-thiouridine(8) synthase ThiI [Clostridia bacterium]